MALLYILGIFSKYSWNLYYKKKNHLNHNHNEEIVIIVRENLIP